MLTRQSGRRKGEEVDLIFVNSGAVVVLLKLGDELTNHVVGCSTYFYC